MTHSWTWSATRASCCSARPPTARTSSTASAPRSRKRLIKEKGFTAVAVEADWPDAYRVNRYVRGMSDDVDAIEALADFRRFPTWMWRNTDVVEFLEWLRAYNDALPPSATKIGFYGLDLYSLRASMEAVLRYLEKVDPEAAKRARARYACFDHFGEDTQVYGFMTRLRPRQIVRGGGRQPARRAATPGHGVCATRWSRGRG